MHCLGLLRCSAWSYGDASRGDTGMLCAGAGGRWQAGCRPALGCAAGSQQAVLLHPTARRCHQGKASSKTRPSPCQLRSRGQLPAGGCSLARTTALSPHAPARSPCSGWWQPGLCTGRAQQLVPAVPTVGKSTFPGGRASDVSPSASQPCPAFPARVTAPSLPPQRPRIPAQSRVGGPVWPQVQAVLLQKRGPGRLSCLGFLSTKRSNPAGSTPLLLTLELLSPPLQGEPRLLSHGRSRAGWLSCP